MKRLCKLFVIIAILVTLIGFSNFTTVYAAGLSLSTSCGPSGTMITVSGSGFEAAAAISFTFDGSSISTTPANVTATEAGSFSNVSLVIPAFTSNLTTHVIMASDGSSAASANFYSPKISTSVTSGKAGTSVTLTGIGFASGESGITADFNNSPLTLSPASPKAGTNGSWSATFSVPSQAGGTYSIEAYGNSNSYASVNFTIVSSSKITLSKTSGPVGSPVTVTGSEFAASETGVKVTFNGETAGSPSSVSSTGGWSFTFNIPTIPSGTYVIDAYGNTTSAASVTGLNFSVTPNFSLNPASASVGGAVSISGAGYGANEEVTVTYDITPNTPEIVAGTIADATGSWSASFIVPASAGGTHAVRAKGTTSSVSPVNFTTGAGIMINKASGKAGTVVTVAGSGFAANETGVTITYDGNAVGQPTTASASGAWTASFSIPASVGGDHSIGAHGKTTPANKITEAIFTITPEVAVDKTSGKVGTDITVSGAGFGANESGIVITYDGTQVVEDITADDKGIWSASVEVPPSTSGAHVIQVNSSIASNLSLGDLKFKVAPGAELDPAQGFVGSTVKLIGSGFAANSPLNIFYDGTQFNIAGAVTTASGTFNIPLTIPKSTAGTHSIKVMDPAGNQIETVFNMDSTAPAMPKLTQPTDGTRMGLMGGITPTLEWSKVTDQSGVTYSLQIDEDPEFDNPVLEIEGLTGNKYTLRQSQALPRGEYFWRVKSVDGASNESNWSEPFIIKSGLISPLVMFLIVILILAAIGLAIFGGLLPRIRRRRASAAASVREIVIPEVVNAEYRTMETEEANLKRALHWKLALPQAPVTRGVKILSTEDQAKLRNIVDFVRSVPLAEPGANTVWLTELAESNTGTLASPEFYARLLQGEISLKYEPAWMRHPTYIDLQNVLEGQPILQDINSFIEGVNHAAAESLTALQEIYRESGLEMKPDLFEKGGWSYITAVFRDSLFWYTGKYLQEPSERDYAVMADGLYGESHAPFAGLLITEEETEAIQLRTLHLKLRQAYRNNEQMSSLGSLISQLEVQRARLLAAFSQFNKLSRG